MEIDGTMARLRLIGINAPETNQQKQVQCFGKEAKAFATKLLLNQKVRLEADPTQQDRDRYGRLLRYIYRQDELFFNK